ncbi:methyltransferase domain-containing protein [Negadavirga shengliensis]|uniref:Methyltransferase domain-containing protein n=1 Tax=Negadavirga shengliensis TaxID=1389218 RepID=A0ABV9SXR7_9BACT
MKKKIKTFFAASDQPESLGSKFRLRRFKFFEEQFYKTFENSDRIKILDVGGTESFWKNNSLRLERNISITLLNLEKEKTSSPNILSVSGNATDLSQFDTGAFDLVFSNSVIEHLYSFHNQKRMAEEIQRVGKHYFVQTPNKYFFLEPHYALPFFQFVPSRLAFLILTKTKFSRMHKWDPVLAKAYLEEIRLLSLREMKNLFPDANVYFEKVMGFNKSFIFHTLGSTKKQKQ